MGDQRTTPSRRADGRVLAAAVVVLLALLVAAVAVRGPAWTTPGRPVGGQAPAPVTSTPVPVTESPRQGSDQSPLLPRSEAAGNVMLVLLLLLGLALLIWLAAGLARAYLANRRAPLAAPVSVTLPEQVLADAADRALVEVEHPDAREAVIRSWLLLGAAAADAGVPARPAETATEYAWRIAAAFAVPTTDLHRLAELYREARFSEHPVGEVQRAEARRLLQRLRSGLTGGIR